MNRLKSTLKKARMPQTALIGRTGFAQARINHYCNNRRQPEDEATAKVIVDAINWFGYREASVSSVFPKLVKADRKKGAR